MASPEPSSDPLPQHAVPASAVDDLMLVSISGPEPIERVLDRTTTGGLLTIGRRTTHGLVLDRPEVSRDHAELRCVETASGMQWTLIDLGSRHQTRLNGQALRANEPCTLQPGDIIEISPWTLRLITRGKFSVRGASGSAISSERRVRTIDDNFAEAPGTMRTIVSGSHDLARERLHLLLSCAEAIVSADDEHSLARAVIDAATRGTGFPNAALLRPLMPDGTISIIADTGAIHPHNQLQQSDSSAMLSRSLIRQASLGQAVALSSGEMIVPTGHSIVDLKIQDAICVPLMLEGAAAGYLYLDTRSDRPELTRRAPRVTDDAGAFAAGLARIAALALMNLMRRDIEKRFGRMEGEIAAAASAQRLVLPPHAVTIGPVRVHGECRPGRVVSGDFFDVMPLTDGRIAIALGDVAGKGMQASVLMTTTQGFLRGVLMHHGNLRQAVNDLNAYLHPRCDGGRFISLWLGAIDPQLSTLEYVNAGHGHAWLHRCSTGASGEFEQLDSAGGPLVGVVDLLDYRSAIIPMHAGDRVVLLSDGIIEQPRGRNREDQFGFQRVSNVLDTHADSPSACIARLFDAVQAHAQGPSLADDATVVLAEW